MKLVGIFFALLSFAAGGTIYEEHFNTLDRNDWVVEVVSNPHNSELQYYTDRDVNIKAEGGKLVITPLKESYGGRMYTSGRMHSNFAWKYGRVEVRAKLPNGFGLWPAIWMMPRDSVYGGWPTSGEIDIMEARGQNLDEIASTIHYGICCDNHYYESSGDLKTQCRNDQYHVYTLDWTPTQLVYRLDGKAYHVHDIDRVISWMYGYPGQPFDQYFYLILNVAVGGHYLEDPKPTTEWNYPDAEMWVDYVKVYPLEDIAKYSCGVKANANPYEVCGNVDWACNMQNYADVSAECTWQLRSCCDSVESCDIDTLYNLASAVYASYDAQVNDANSCDFSGTAERSYQLFDGVPQKAQCLIKPTANAKDICSGMIWACSDDNSYADVSSECSQGDDVLSCCYSNPYSCNDARLRSASQNVFQAYYNQIPSSTSCDFGGVCFLENSLIPLQCQNGFGF